ncbi:A24 family peptidase [Cyanobium sp. NIES-981]|uniref:prepilin peptidase n=1 Tax=Cyanobium sp. NIES-981 TaxID=1851505 RepID=UPI0007DE19B4|nr:A24 family peptidase [Cyanobium sp. NIES-981]SBO41967.1 Type 4 prepilin-like proteins leader peptide-processing enzyme [Includes: Leader peptidase; N-methyltransferase] [Cyanobium sp. NIES-981]
MPYALQPLTGPAAAPAMSALWFWTACVLGACVGSFLNVVAWRQPRQESLLHPPSHCPRCGTRLRWHDNIPVLGWLLIRGRCRHCHAPVSPRYPLVELLTAGLWVAAVLAPPQAMGPAPWGPGQVLAGWLLLSWLIPLTLIDLDRLWLPEPLCRIGLLLGLGCTALLGFAQGGAVGKALVFHHLLAAGAGLLGFEAVSALAERLIGKPALGLGDAKLAALLGAWLGLTGLGLTVVIAVTSGAAVGLAGRLSGRLGRHDPMPFGPFLAAGGAGVWLLGHGPWLQLLGSLGLVPGP